MSTPRPRAEYEVARLVLVLAGAAAAGCGVGDGLGEVTGSIFVNDCNGVDRDFGTIDSPRDDFDMKPTFFAGDPIEDLLGRNNRLLIRIQRDGKRIEGTDALVFDVQNAFEVARCVRSLTKDGQPDWDPLFCDASSGKPRFKVGVDQPVRATLTLLGTCQVGRPVAVAVSEPGTTGDLWESWVEFQEFGSVRPGAGEPVPDFKVRFGERLQASDFQLTLADDRLVKARRAGQHDVRPEIGGLLFGRFDFDLKRGRAGQSFP